MAWETESNSRISGRIDADTSVGGGSSSYTGDSETLRITARSDDWYIGVQNESSAGGSDFFIGLGEIEDGIFHIQNDGKIGIGHTAPTSILDVNGTIKATSMQSNGQTVATIADVDTVNVYWAETVGVSLAYGSEVVKITNATGSTTTSTGCLVLSGGLGITEKTYMGNLLDVSGTLTVGSDGTGHLVTFNTDTSGASYVFSDVVDTGLTLGADLKGVDFKAFGVTAGKFLQWDNSEDELIIGGGADLRFDTASNIFIKDNSATSLKIAGGGDTYITFNTSDTTEKITVAQDTEFTGDVTLSGAKKLDISNAAGYIELDSTLSASDSVGTSGSIRTLGGVSIKKNLYVGNGSGSGNSFFNVGSFTLNTNDGGFDINNVAGGISQVRNTGGGALNITSTGLTALSCSGGFVNAVSILATGDNGGIDIGANTGGIAIDTSGPFTLTSTEGDTSASPSANDYTLGIISDSGTSTERILIESNSGTLRDSIRLYSTKGGIKIETADAGNTKSDIILNAASSLEFNAAKDSKIDTGAGKLEIDSDNAEGIKIGTNSSKPVEIGDGSTNSKIKFNSPLFLQSSGEVSSGAITLTDSVTYFDTAGTETSTLAVGTDGQVKMLAMTTDLGDMTVTVTDAAWNAGASGTLTFNAIGDACTLVYSNAKWNLVGNNGVDAA